MNKNQTRLWAFAQTLLHKAISPLTNWLVYSFSFMSAEKWGLKMIDYGKTRSTVQPEPLAIDEYSIWINTNIKPVTETVGDETFEGFEYDMVRYDKDEYIQIMAVKAADVERQLTDTQLALCEIYEGMV